MKPSVTEIKKVALVHDWFTGMRGGELVFDAIAELFPQAHLFTLIYQYDDYPKAIRRLPRSTSFLDWIPGISRIYRRFLPLMPLAVRSLNLDGYDLVISSSHCVAKGVRKSPYALHVSYVYAPMRYMWDRFDEYFGVRVLSGIGGWITRQVARAVRPAMQAWDRRVSQPDRVDEILTLSQFIRERIREFYGREAQVIAPFVEFERFVRPRRPEAFYFMLGAFAPYKRVDLAVEAFTRLGLPLWVAGGGQDEKRIRKLAGPGIRFLGEVSNDEAADYYSRCKAFVFPGKEDFGITPLEALAAGAPVIALGQGGALETVTAETGVFFAEETVESLTQAIKKFENGVAISETACRDRAREFSRAQFQKKFVAALEQAWQNHPLCRT